MMAPVCCIAQAADKHLAWDVFQLSSLLRTAHLIAADTGRLVGRLQLPRMCFRLTRLCADEISDPKSHGLFAEGHAGTT